MSYEYQPVPVCRSMYAVESTNILTSAVWPWVAAACNGAQPFLSCRLRSACASSISSASASVRPGSAACSAALLPWTSQLQPNIKHRTCNTAGMARK